MVAKASGFLGWNVELRPAGQGNAAQGVAPAPQRKNTL
jgi:hypothetical protein